MRPGGVRVEGLLYDQLVFGKPSVKQGFPFILDLHSLTQRVADQADVIALL